MMAGTDGGGSVPGQSMREEFAELARAGLPPLAILRAATSAPATFLGRAQGIGAEADLLLLDADPLESHEHLTAIHTVVRAGHVIPGPALARSVSDAAAGAGAERPVCC
jgi:imidazolonepropionase-like amidohydrolase